MSDGINKLFKVKVEVWALLVAGLSLALSGYQNVKSNDQNSRIEAQRVRIEIFDKALNSPELGFDITINRDNEWYEVSLINNGMVPIVIKSTRVNGINHSSVSIDNIRGTIFDILLPILSDDVTSRDIRYAGYSSDSTMAVGEKTILFGVKRIHFESGLAGEHVLRYFNKNIISIQYSSLADDREYELNFMENGD